MSEECENCGGGWDRPGLNRCNDPQHVRPTLSQRIVADIERELNGRRGMKWGNFDDETLRGLRDKLASIVDGHINGIIS